MSDFRIVIEGSGGHGCKRDVDEGKLFYGCGKMGCPDCELNRFLGQSQVRAMVKVATFIHWPGTEHEVVDEYRVVDGQFVQARRVHGAFR